MGPNTVIGPKVLSF